MKKISIAKEYRDKCDTYTSRIKSYSNIPDGFEVDHIIPISFCRKLGITPEQASYLENIQFITHEENSDKWFFIDGRNLLHLKILCKLWEVPFPSTQMIVDHNKKAFQTQGSFIKKVS